jgi:DNA replication protein DnaC
MNQVELLNDVLPRIGMTPKLRSATEERIPATIRPLIPERENLGTGFSLMGTTGSGKSSTQAWYVKKSIYEGIKNYSTLHNIEDYSYDDYRLFQCPWMRKPYKVVSWIYWPDIAQKLQDAARDGWKPGDNHTQPHPEQMKTATWLILDDLGRERCKSDSYAVGQLESIIHHRYEHSLTTFWNSNLDAPGLIDQYGAPLVDRLRGLSPVLGNGWVKLDSLR